MLAPLRPSANGPGKARSEQPRDDACMLLATSRCAEFGWAETGIRVGAGGSAIGCGGQPHGALWSWIVASEVREYGSGGRGPTMTDTAWFALGPG